MSNRPADRTGYTSLGRTSRTSFVDTLLSQQMDTFPPACEGGDVLHAEGNKDSKPYKPGRFSNINWAVFLLGPALWCFLNRLYLVPILFFLALAVSTFADIERPAIVMVSVWGVLNVYFALYGNQIISKRIMRKGFDSKFEERERRKERVRQYKQLRLGGWIIALTSFLMMILLFLVDLPVLTWLELCAALAVQYIVPLALTLLLASKLHPEKNEIHAGELDEQLLRVVKLRPDADIKTGPQDFSENTILQRMKNETVKRIPGVVLFALVVLFGYATYITHEGPEVNHYLIDKVRYAYGYEFDWFFVLDGQRVVVEGYQKGFFNDPLILNAGVIGLGYPFGPAEYTDLVFVGSREIAESINFSDSTVVAWPSLETGQGIVNGINLTALRNNLDLRDFGLNHPATMDNLANDWELVRTFEELSLKFDGEGFRAALWNGSDAFAAELEIFNMVEDRDVANSILDRANSLGFTWVDKRDPILDLLVAAGSPEVFFEITEDVPRIDSVPERQQRLEEVTDRLIRELEDD